MIGCVLIYIGSTAVLLWEAALLFTGALPLVVLLV